MGAACADSATTVPSAAGVGAGSGGGVPPSATTVPAAAGVGAGSGGGVPPNAGQMGLCAHQSQTRLGRGRQSPDSRARSMARHSASTLRSVARRSASSGWYLRISPLPRYMSCSSRGTAPRIRHSTRA